MMAHQCPGPKCPVTDVDDKQLACRAHWFQVTVPIRQAVYRAWDSGRGRGTPGHTKACELAIAQMRPLARRPQ